MIKYINIQRFDDLDFEAYKAMNKERQAYSFSFLNKERHGQLSEIEITDNMRIGSLVDGILTGPAEVNFCDPLYNVGRDIAFEIQKQFGAVIQHLDKQVSYFADACFQGYTMPTNGRLDFLIPKHAIIDLKVTGARNWRQLIDHMGYRNQVRHYGGLAGVGKGYIMIYSRPLKKTFIEPVDMSGENEWMQNKILKFGTPNE